MSLKHDLQNIISGNGSVRHGENIQAITSYLRRKKEAISRAQEKEYSKDQETEILVEFIHQNSLWFRDLDDSKYIGAGAEQKVYDYTDPRYILKLNDTIFYRSWYDYFNNLLIHNYFFEDVPYHLVGFLNLENKLNAVVIQPYIRTVESTDLSIVKELLALNGFTNKKNNDYYHPDLGIIIEGLHDENVLTSYGVLQFIDTVIYLTDAFYL